MTDARWLAASDARHLLFGVAALAWLALCICDQPGSPIMKICSTNGGSVWLNASVTLDIAAGDAFRTLLSLLLMIAGMTAINLVAPVRYLWDRSLARHRIRAIALFMAGYTAIWFVVSAVLLVGSLTLASIFARLILLPVLALMALVWQFSTARRACLRHCDDRPPLSIFGPQSAIDPVTFGVRVGFWCAGTCWLWMLVVFALGTGHLIGMAALSVLTMLERSDLAREVALFGWRNTAAGLRLRLQRSAL